MGNIMKVGDKVIRIDYKYSYCTCSGGRVVEIEDEIISINGFQIHAGLFRVTNDVELLDLCIAHWRDIVADPGVYPGRTQCALCAVYNSPSLLCKTLRCFECPIFRQKTGRPYCDDTPYVAYVNKRSKENAEAEVKFLQEIRDELQN
jgi:hypothetical protein